MRKLKYRNSQLTIPQSRNPAISQFPNSCITHETPVRVSSVEGRIFQLNSSPGGVPKLAVREALVNNFGMMGDGHNFPKIHGGPERALCLFSLECILELQKAGHPIFPGAVGENVTISGIDWNLVAPGRQMALGDEVLVKIVNYTSPCNSIPDSFLDGNYSRISQKVHPGWSRVYASVLNGGRLRVGQLVQILQADGES